MLKTGKISWTEKITYTALLIAMQVVLGNLIQIPLVDKQFNLGFLPIAVAGAFFGIPSAMAVGALGDFFGAHLFPQGAYFLGFTITNALVGLIYGILLYQKKVSWLRILLACFLVSLCNLFLNSYWLTYFISKAYWVIWGGRLLTYLIDLPLAFVSIYAVLQSTTKAMRHIFPLDSKDDSAKTQKVTDGEA